MALILPCVFADILATALVKLPPVAFVADVAGPLFGADLLRLRDVERMASGMVKPRHF